MIFDVKAVTPGLQFAASSRVRHDNAPAGRDHVPACRPSRRDKAAGRASMHANQLDALVWGMRFRHSHVRRIPTPGSVMRWTRGESPLPGTSPWRFDPEGVPACCVLEPPTHQAQDPAPEGLLQESRRAQRRHASASAEMIAWRGSRSWTSTSEDARHAGHRGKCKAAATGDDAAVVVSRMSQGRGQIRMRVFRYANLNAFRRVILAGSLE